MCADDLHAAIDRVAAGEVVVDAELVSSLLARSRDADRDPLRELTNRERDVLALMAEGLTDKGIAERLWITPNTVETHVRHILRKLAVHDSTSHNRRVHAVLTFLRAA
jgi:DNA-binding NarL/FixJ family response regulator